MARPGRSEDTSEDTSVPIWLKLSAVDSAKMDQVLARPEFEGWTRGEWCLEIIQTALRYYTKPRPAGEPGRKRAPGTRAAEPSPPPAETEPVATESAPPARRPERVVPQRPRLQQPPRPEQPPSGGTPEPEQAQARPERQPRQAPQPRRQVEPEPRLSRQAPEPEPSQSRRAGPSRRAPQSRRPAEPEQRQVRRTSQAKPGPDATRSEPINPGPADLGELDSVGDPETECSHPAEARDYQSGTCGACGAILWD